MTPTEIDQLVGEKVAAAISAYAATQNNGVGSKSVGGQETAVKNAEGKRKRDENHGENLVHYPNKKQKIIKVSNEGQNVKKGYAGCHPYRNQCNKHHPDQCTMVCKKCKKVGHMAKDCRVVTPIAKAVAPRTCYKCGAVGHIMRSCPKLKRQTLRTYEVTTEENHQNLN